TTSSCHARVKREGGSHSRTRPHTHRWPSSASSNHAPPAQGSMTILACGASRSEFADGHQVPTSMAKRVKASLCGIVTNTEWRIDSVLIGDLLAYVHRLTECLKRPRPEGIEVGPETRERLRVRPVQATSPLGILVHKTGILKDRQVLRDGGAADR